MQIQTTNHKLQVTVYEIILLICYEERIQLELGICCRRG